MTKTHFFVLQAQHAQFWVYKNSIRTFQRTYWGCFIEIFFIKLYNTVFLLLIFQLHIKIWTQKDVQFIHLHGKFRFVNPELDEISKNWFFSHRYFQESFLNCQCQQYDKTWNDETWRGLFVFRKGLKGSFGASGCSSEYWFYELCRPFRIPRIFLIISQIHVLRIDLSVHFRAQWYSHFSAYVTPLFENEVFRIFNNKF